MAPEVKRGKEKFDRRWRQKYIASLAPEVKGGRRNTRPSVAPEVKRGLLLRAKDGRVLLFHRFTDKETFVPFFRFFPPDFLFFLKSKFGGAVYTRGRFIVRDLR